MKIIIKNKDAFFNYEILEKYKAGLILKGWEVKSIRENKVQLKGAFITFKNDEAYITNMHISQYMSVKGNELEPRKLLLNKHEIRHIQDKKNRNSLAVIPLNLFWDNNYIKLEIALAKGKTKADKRHRILEKDVRKHLKKITY
ncbi:SsrA-binding protein SmpB [[Mycoplasma] mobile]|uniref:SsrA-binding protein n=1 Tax=Mycoplasma mobile (strain ATCC 43663 / 163K / NCTC 11711) TaxID=267748 RepID=SSRP_MYCM1|nr:SsrA-binding protein SmpB [[Mycoplasma] mobile]Q6KI26.1 RecName: Full=SsrA-binding protein; AltName: Full=Small protein B [Mycoplasma mobile 163K]AAT27750.1 ssra-binding protein [Mycoplasma mobile 163K]